MSISYSGSWNIHGFDPFQETVQRITAEAVLLGKIVQIAASQIASPDLRELPAVFKPEFRSVGRERPVTVDLQFPCEGGEIGIGDLCVRETSGMFFFCPENLHRKSSGREK